MRTWSSAPLLRQAYQISGAHTSPPNTQHTDPSYFPGRPQPHTQAYPHSICVYAHTHTREHEHQPSLRVRDRGGRPQPYTPVPHPRPPLCAAGARPAATERLPPASSHAHGTTSPPAHGGAPALPTRLHSSPLGPPPPRLCRSHPPPSSRRTHAPPPPLPPGYRWGCGGRCREPTGSALAAPTGWSWSCLPLPPSSRRVVQRPLLRRRSSAGGDGRQRRPGDWEAGRLSPPDRGAGGLRRRREARKRGGGGGGDGASAPRGRHRGRRGRWRPEGGGGRRAIGPATGASPAAQGQGGAAPRCEPAAGADDKVPAGPISAATSSFSFPISNGHRRRLVDGIVSPGTGITWREAGRGGRATPAAALGGGRGRGGAGRGSPAPRRRSGRSRVGKGQGPCGRSVAARAAPLLPDWPSP